MLVITVICTMLNLGVILFIQTLQSFLDMYLDNAGYPSFVAQKIKKEGTRWKKWSMGAWKRFFVNLNELIFIAIW